MTYGYTNRNHRGENHVFSFIIYHSLTVSSWVSKQPHWAVMRTACCHCAGAAGACASRAGTCRASRASPCCPRASPPAPGIRRDAGRSGRMWGKSAGMRARGRGARSILRSARANEVQARSSIKRPLRLLFRGIMCPISPLSRVAN